MRGRVDRTDRPASPRSRSDIPSPPGPLSPKRGEGETNFWGWVWLSSLLALTATAAGADQSTLSEPLDLFPPRFRVPAGEDAVQIRDQDNVADPAAGGGRCERFSVTFAKTPAWIILPIDPVQPVDELTATLAVRTLRPGVRAGFRVRLPHVRSETGQTQTFFVPGDPTTRGGEFQRIGIANFTPAMRQQIGVLRRRLGPLIDIADAHVDAVAIDVTSAGSGATVSVDDVQIRGMLAATAAPPAGPPVRLPPQIDASESVGTAAMVFPPGRVTTMIEHRGEPLGYLRTLGFDTVWLDRPPSAAILTDASVAGMRLIAPPPTMPDPQIQPLLGPVTAWIVDSVRLDDAGRDAALRQIQTLRQLPSRYRRPVVGVVLENEAFYARHLDAVLLNPPPAVREIDSLTQAIGCRRRIESIDRADAGAAVTGWAIDGGPSTAAATQSEAFSAAMGTPAPQFWRWQTMWSRCGAAIGNGTAAILLRSGSSLSSGRAIDQSRATALRYVNRMIDSLGPLTAMADRTEPPRRVGDAIVYRMRVDRGATGPGWVNILVSARDSGASRVWPGSPTLAGDGAAVTLPVAASENVTVWRLTQLDADPLRPGGSVGTAELLSPDWVEWTLETADRSAGGRLAATLRPHLAAAAADRLELATAAIDSVEQTWRSAIASGWAAAPPEVLPAAAQSLAAARQSLAGGRPAAAMRLAARADGWAVRAASQLHETLIAGGSQPVLAGQTSTRRRVSFPPVAAADDETTLAVWRLLAPMDSPAPTAQPTSAARAARWSTNSLSGGSLDLPQLLSGDGAGGGWQFGRRPAGDAVVTAGWTDRGWAAGGGAIAAAVRPGPSGEPIGGGYGGTTLMVRSPPVVIDRDGPVTIEAMVRASGFGDPHQGLLMHDSLGTQSLGVLVPGDGVWTHVRLLRLAVAGQRVEAIFEWIGGGEAVVDEVSIRSFIPPTDRLDPTVLMRPISAAGAAPVFQRLGMPQ